MKSFTKMINRINKSRLLAKDNSKIAQKMKKTDSSIPIFPPEVIIEILTHIRPKSLIRLQLVCKQWRDFIHHDHYLIEKHMDRTGVVHHWHNVVSVRNIDGPERFQFYYLHGLNGLLLIKILRTNKIIIWNPATRRVFELPDTHNHNYGFVLSYIPQTNTYKIVSVYNNTESGRKCCEVFLPGHSDQTWRHLPFPENVNLNWQVNGKGVSVIPSGRAIHYLLTAKTDNETFDEIVSLDIETEIFTLNYAPKGHFTDWTKVYSLDWDGKLAFAYINDENLEVMVLEDYKRQIWCKNKRVFHLKFMRKYGYGLGKLVPLFAKEGDIWFWLETAKVFSYNLETGLITDVARSKGFSVKEKVYPYKPSLVNIEGMQAEDPGLHVIRPRMLD